MARKVETLTVFLSHNIGLQLSNSEGGGGIPMFAPTPLKCLVFLKRNLLLGQGRLRFFFFSMGNNGFNCLEVRGPLGRKYQADKQEQSNAAARCILDLHSRIP